MAMIRKEFLQLRRDRHTALFVLLAPVVELVLFGYAGNTNVQHLSTAVFDQSQTAASRELVAAFHNSDYFDITLQASSGEEAVHAIDASTVRVAIVIPHDFGDHVLNGDPAEVQMVIDGTDANVAQTALSAGNQVAQAQGVRILSDVANREGRANPPQPVDLRPVVLYNPSLLSVAAIVPGLVGLFVPLQATLLTAFAVIRERERGTMEQLVVMPITRLELMLGKMLPSAVLAFASMIMSFVTARILFGLNIAGSIPLLLVLTVPFVLGALGIGLLISVVSKTQPQAQQAAQATLVPSLFLSGVLFPREGLPPVLQFLGNFIPQTYFIEVIRGIMLKDVGLAILWRQGLALTAFGLATFALAIRLFQKRLD
jgi:ABC-2 type transport system permease protein